MASVPVADGVAAAQSAFARALFDEFARGGARRRGRLPRVALDAARARRGRRPTACALHVRLDERSAGFFAIGRALATRRPVAVVVTSGTAAAELTAAVVEADLAGVPLVVVTADRPPELRGVGAPQTIDQVKLYGSAVRRVEDPGAIRPGSAPSWRALASRLLAAAVAGSGPVHLNVPLVEPLDAARVRRATGARARRAVAGGGRAGGDLGRCVLDASPAAEGCSSPVVARATQRSCSPSRSATAGRSSPTRSRARGSSTPASSRPSTR